MKTNLIVLIQLRGFTFKGGSVGYPDGSRFILSLGNPRVDSVSISFNVSLNMTPIKGTLAFPCEAHKCLMLCRTDHIVQFVGAALRAPQRDVEPLLYHLTSIVSPHFVSLQFQDWCLIAVAGTELVQCYELHPAGTAGHPHHSSVYWKKNKQSGQTGALIQVFILQIAQ